MPVSTQYLPQPLSEDEQNELLQLLQQRPDSAIKTKLIEHNLRLVVFLVRRYEKHGVPLEDLVSIGTIGLIRAINNYEESKGNFMEQVRECVIGEIDKFMEQSRKWRNNSDNS